MHGESLSIIMPVYNAEKYLRRALDSVFFQTYPVYEVICVDDGSTDKSLDILNEYAKRDARFKVFHKENAGLVNTRKIGLSKVTGTYVTYVDPDDFIEKTMYEEMMGFAQKYHADLITSGLIRDYGSSKVINEEKIERGVYTENSFRSVLKLLIDTNSFYSTGILPSLCNKIFRTEKLRCVQNNVDDRIRVGEDDAVVYPYLFRSNSIVVCGKSYYHYCIRENGSIMGEKTPDESERLHIFLQYLKNEFENADMPGLGLMKQFEILKIYYLMLRSPSDALRYEGGILYPFGRVVKTDKILIYGAGKFGVEMKAYLEREGFEVVGWIDKSATREKVMRLEDTDKVCFDAIIIAVLIADTVRQIRKELEDKGIPDEKILCVDARMIE